MSFLTNIYSKIGLVCQSIRGHYIAKYLDNRGVKQLMFEKVRRSDGLLIRATIMFKHREQREPFIVV